MNRDSPQLEYLNETHRSICKLFNGKFKQDWLDHNVACDRWFDDGFRFDLTSFTLHLFYMTDHIGDMTKTDFDASFKSLENALKKTKRELNRGSTQELLRSINLSQYDFQKEKISFTDFLKNPEKNFTSLLKADVNKILNKLQMYRYNIENNVWTKHAKTKPPKSLERQIAYELIEKFHLQFDKLPLAAGSKSEPSSKLIDTANDIFSLRDLSKDARAACRDALNYSQKIFGIA
jgi:hypothetical protein